MGKFLKNNMLWIGAVVGVIGLILTLVSFTFHFGEQPTWLAAYGKIVIFGEAPNDTNLNLWVMIVAPIVLLTGAWYFGEQIWLRKKFERLLDTPKKSEFLQKKRALEDIARQLPDEYHDRIDAREADFKSRRAA